MLLPIVQNPDSQLHQPSLPVDPVRLRTPAFEQFIRDCYDTMKEADGIGIAAAQVGALDRVFIAQHGTMSVIMVNPEILWQSQERETNEEGCLSVPNVDVDVDRARTVRIRYTDLTGVTHEIKARGLYARILQHELDHLNGILITDRGTLKPKNRQKHA